MIKRPLDKGFRSAVVALIKDTTMRNKPWSLGVPIMLYSWAGAPYRSKHEDLIPVIAASATLVMIIREGDILYYDVPHGLLDRSLWQCEGFDSQEHMDDWFRKLVKPGKKLERYLMKFRPLNETELKESHSK
jgi:hypothetical protein